jgi:hypothetical protein
MHIRILSVLMLGVFRAAAAGSLPHHEPQRITKPDGPSGPVSGCFGRSVAIAGKYAFVGDPCQDGGAGIAFRLKRSGAEWVIDRAILSPAPVPDGGFGTGLAVNKTSLAVGAPGEGSSGTVDVYQPFNGELHFAGGHSPSSIDPGARYGQFVAPYSGLTNTFIASAPNGDCDGEDQRGFVLAFSGINYAICAPQALSNFGAAIAVRENQALITAPGGFGTIAAGYLWDMGVPGIIAPQMISLFVPTDPNANRRFGKSADLGASVAVFGAPISSDGLAISGAALIPGEVWIYRGSVPNWKIDDILVEPTDQPTQSFGTSVRLMDSSLLAGSPETPAGGAVYRYDYVDGAWTVTDAWNANSEDSDALGSSLSSDQMTWISGAPDARSEPGGAIVGAAYISTDDYVFLGDFE